jgi:hypothetical protein
MEVGVQGLGGVLGFKLYLNLNKISDWALRTSLGLQSPGVSVGAAGTGVPQTDWGVRANASSFRVYGLAGPSVEATYYYVGGPNIKFSNGLLTERLNPDGTAASQYPEMNLGQNYNQESPKAVSGPSASVTLDFIVNSRDWGLLFGPFGPWFQHLAETPAPDNHRWLGDAYPGYHN